MISSYNMHNPTGGRAVLFGPGGALWLPPLLGDACAVKQHSKLTPLQHTRHTVQASFDTMAQSTFKRHLRRSLPVTRSKFPWEQAQHKLAGELASKEKAAAAAAAGRG